MISDSQPWNTIFSAIRATQAHEPSCDDLSDELLAAFAERITAQAAPGGALLEVEQHLRHCTACQHLVDELVDTLALLAQEDMAAWPEPAQPFDLGFLPAPALLKSVPPRVVDACAAGAAWVEDQEQALWISLASTFTSPSSFKFATSTKGPATDLASTEHRKPLLQLVFGAEETNNLDVEVIAKQEADPHLCTLTVQAIMPSRWPQIGGIEVELHAGSSTRHMQTDEDGQAIFNGISIRDLPQMFVHIQP